jgi:hypothetical protein
MSFQLQFPVYPSSRNESFQTDSEYDVEDRENIIQVERQMFLKAALQLLDERDQSLSITPNSGRTFRSDVIRCGRLKKANRRNALTSMAPRVWKNKIVEIKYGIFYYEDECISKADLVENIWRKSIVLSAHSTTCREVKVKGVHEGCIFQLSTAGGAKRTFLASTPADCEAWMKAIFTAMPAILSARPSWNQLSSPDKNDVKKRTKSFTFFKRQTSKGKGSGKDDGGSMDALMISSLTSLPGPAAKYAQDIVYFCTEQSKMANAEKSDEFRKAILNLRESNARIRIPVFFVKVRIRILLQ